ncbi:MULTISPECIES: BLUF domain-containing protein [Derxia]|uniref:BLUF domain-containing protein n=1 Tax=Derxia gummosa DSM 723 TaxID=1121388 RepID=A0A8B6X8R3_9BURK|nr:MULTISPECIES: BLUF domain-containing protein [Derxia]
MIELIHTSEPGDSNIAARIAQLARESRRGNRAAGLTGLLIFDGWRCCEYLEGEAEALDRRLGLLAADPALGSVTVRHRAPLALPERRFHGWSLSFAEPAGPHSLDALFANLGPACIVHLLALMPWLDSAPGGVGV